MNDTNSKIAEGLGLGLCECKTLSTNPDDNNCRYCQKPKLEEYTESRDITAGAVIAWCGEDEGRWQRFGGCLYEAFQISGKTPSFRECDPLILLLGI